MKPCPWAGRIGAGAGAADHFLWLFFFLGQGYRGPSRTGECLCPLGQRLQCRIEIGAKGLNLSFDRMKRRLDAHVIRGCSFPDGFSS